MSISPGGKSKGLDPQGRVCDVVKTTQCPIGDCMHFYHTTWSACCQRVRSKVIDQSLKREIAKVENLLEKPVWKRE